jgi:hypothetical protein
MVNSHSIASTVVDSIKLVEQFFIKKIE